MGVTKIPSSAFSGCTSLAQVTMHDGITEIGGNSFRNCTSLTKIYVPLNITKIDAGAFYGCKNLGVAYYDGGQTKWNSVTVGTSNQPLTDALLFMWTETTVSEDGKSFTVTPKNVENGVTVIIALYKNGNLSNKKI